MHPLLLFQGPESPRSLHHGERSSKRRRRKLGLAGLANRLLALGLENDAVLLGHSLPNAALLIFGNVFVRVDDQARDNDPGDEFKREDGKEDEYGPIDAGATPSVRASVAVDEYIGRGFHGEQDGLENNQNQNYGLDPHADENTTEPFPYRVFWRKDAQRSPPERVCLGATSSWRERRSLLGVEFRRGVLFGHLEQLRRIGRVDQHRGRDVTWPTDIDAGRARP